MTDQTEEGSGQPEPSIVPQTVPTEETTQVPDLVVSQPASAEMPELAEPAICPTVTLTKPFSEPVGKLKEIQNPIHFMRVPNKVFEKVYKNYPKLDPENDKRIRDWLSVLQRARRHNVLDDTFEKSFERPGSDWQQFVEFNGAKMALRKPVIGGGVTAGEKLSGMKARLKMQSAINLGTPAMIPLFHSGIWLTVDTPSDGALLNMERQIFADKVNLGRITQGAVFSHTSVYMANHLIKMVMEHVHDSTIKDFDPEQALDIIRITDMIAMIWGLACTIYPAGHHYQQPCVMAPDKCTYIAEETIKLQNIFFHDNTGLTVEQKRHMSNSNAKYTIDEIKAYQRMGRVSDGKTVTLSAAHDDIQLVLRVPTLRNYIETGYAWVEHIVETVDRIINSDASIDEKNDFIQRHSLISVFRQYGHWVEKIIFSDGSEISDREDIEVALTSMSSDTTLYEKFFAAIQDYIEEVTITIVGIPSYKCPACGTPMTSEESKHPYIIPIEIMQTFFTLSHRRLDRIRPTTR